MGVSSHAIRTVGLVTVVFSLTASFWIYHAALNSRYSYFRLGTKRCRSLAKSTPQHSRGYTRRDQVIDLDGVPFAAYKWDGEIGRQEFDAAADARSDRVLFKIFNSTLYVRSDWKKPPQETRFVKIIEPVLMALHMYQIPDMDFWVELSDNLECNRPVFTYSVNIRCEKGGFAIPSSGAYSAALGEEQLDVLHECLNMNFPYDDRIPKGVWRGSTTGPPMTNKTYMENRRVRLAVLGQQRKNIMDVGLYKYVQVKSDVKELLSETVPLVQRVEMEDYNKYALILDLDGNGWSDRLSTLISYNTPLFKQTTNYHEYFGHLLEPGVHVETFNESLVDVVPKLEELLGEYKSDPKRLQEMADSMHAFVKEHGSHLGLIRAVAYGLNVYASKLTWKTELESGFVEVKKSRCCRKNRTFPAQFRQGVSAG